MKWRALIIALASVGLISAKAPKTETDLGSRISHPARAVIPDLGYSVEDRGRIAMRQFAQCTFASQPRRVVDALMLGPGKDDNALAELASDECLQAGEMKFSPILYRGELFGEMYRRHEDVGAAHWKWPVPAIDFSAPLASQTSEEARGNYVMMALADCVSEREPAAVRSIVMNEVASKSEKAAFVAVIGVLGSCIPKGTTLRMNRTSLEAAFGEYMYRSLVAKIPVPTGKPS